MPTVKTLIAQERITARIGELGQVLSAQFKDKDPICVCVLKGCFPFFADLVRAMDIPLRTDFLGVSSYGSGTETTGVVRLTHDLSESVQGQHVIIMEDIVDTGLTMHYLLEAFRARDPASLTIVTLLHKPARKRVEVTLDHVGFTIDDVFVVGYGLDYDGYYRNLPYIGVMDPDA